ncbi:DNA polymerase III subunit gamma/tau [Thorsellia anophelis]|uniref:DNA polymerase III subunit gamma/tau n=1 Tax=Thorsellia anophelis DSM 18579 TaxID=1123402 RepID=A0A1H9YM28_9GAMM|nr:DNA polymerase III subunit gamma/tau [Thorsellia anophelis]SES70094.1 DNA polymerase-3 subunit gamma/tau [Thorsellia anophelis DSM 18579]
MSYQVLARKWRPQTFSQVIGQEHVLAALANGLKLGRIHHAYLFSGTRGVGKTSIARLLAKGLNCETGITDAPCGKCGNCLEIEQGRFVDLLEIDAASRTKVEDTRDLLDNVQYAPVRGRFKVYLIDEVHMLSRHSFNALLKTLEEPPAHVKFLLATTDPQKLPITILSRCLQFNLRAMDISQITQQLEYILTKEAVPFDSKALQLLARSADGSMRDALSLTDQAIASGNNQVTTETVIQMLGMLDDEQPMTIAESIIRGQPEVVFEQIKLISQKGGAWQDVLIEVAALFHQIALLQLLPGALEPQHQHNEAKLRDLARIVSPTDLQVFYQIILVGRKELPYAPDPKMGVEMTLLRALAFHPQKAVTPAQITTMVSSESQSNSKINQSSTAPQVIQLTTAPATKESAQSSTTLSDNQLPVREPTNTQEISPSKANVIAPNSPTSALLQAREKIRQQQEQIDGKKFKAAEDAAKYQTRKNHIESANPVASKKLPDASIDTTLSSANDLSLEMKLKHHEKIISQTKGEQENTSDENDANNYQWRAQVISDNIESKTTVKQIKDALELEKTPELQNKLVEASILRDEWAKIIPELKVTKLVEQLALNTLYAKTENKIKLGYRSTHKHLAHNGNKQKLEEALSIYFDESIELSLYEEDNKALLTPYEHRHAVYAELLAQAKTSILADQHLQKLCLAFNAKIDEESIKPI